ncbi:radical SAM protein [Streptomyces sp. NPDC091371]|uniref:radical SAM/SPASM domain-containing protein n=1 Tax=Streptomyces sp. NPDC091371 TaxID=3155303 RepID=UPI00342C7EF2
MTGPYEPSGYNIICRLADGRALVHNTASGATALLERAEVAVLDHGSESGAGSGVGGVAAELVAAGFLQPRERNELAALEDEYWRTRNNPATQVLTVAPTLACNFGCDYCFQGTDKPVGRMPPRVQDALVDFVAAALSPGRRLHISWYGGEPLMAKDIVYRLSERFAELVNDMQDAAYDAVIVTNGYLLDEDAAAALWQHGVRLAQITIDGRSDFHNARRALLKGTATYDRILRNIQNALLTTGMRITVRVNIDDRNRASIEDLLWDLAARGLAETGRFSVYFAPVEAITQGCHAVSEATMTKQEYAVLETSLQRLAFELGLAPLPYPRRFLGICGALAPDGVVCAPNGDLHKCWDTISMPHLKVGSLLDGKARFKQERLSDWARWSPFEQAACRNCRLLPSCGGACAHKFVNPEQTAGEAASLPCPSWKYDIKRRLLTYAVANGLLSGAEAAAADFVTTRADVVLDPGGVVSHEDLAGVKPARVDPAGLAGGRRLLPLEVV